MADGAAIAPAFKARGGSVNPDIDPPGLPDLHRDPCSRRRADHRDEAPRKDHLRQPHILPKRPLARGQPENRHFRIGKVTSTEPFATILSFLAQLSTPPHHLAPAWGGQTSFKQADQMTEGLEKLLQSAPCADLVPRPDQQNRSRCALPLALAVLHTIAGEATGGFSQIGFRQDVTAPDLQDVEILMRKCLKLMGQPSGPGQAFRPHDHPVIGH